MLRTGFKGWVMAAGFALAAATGAASASAQTPAPVATSPATAATAAPTGLRPADSNQGPAGGSVQASDAAPASPSLAMDGAPPLSALADPTVGRPIDGVIHIQPQVTKNGLRAHWFHDRILFPLITIISILVLVLLVVVVIKFRASANPTPSRTSHNTFIEVVWTLVPVLILVAIAVPSIGLLQAQFKPAPAGAVTLKAIGNQWFWSYQYPDHGGVEITANMLKEGNQVAPGERARTDVDGPRLLATDNRVVLPVGVPIRLITTANDVIHSWAVPAFWIKLDAIPGRLNETSFTIDKPGLYFGQCSELCGARHAFMPIAVEAVTPAQFAAWVRAKGGTMPTPGKASDAVIPQPGADNSAAAADEAAVANAMTGPLENGTVTSPTSPQGATGNPGGVGEAGR
ncbi:cytochrome C oxidase subunit II [Sphingomonas sp. Leaf231]|uniref:cytochrome c oxidase subunit II n=1 Tax=Sphingomonas sp. Leaf231 TaxID=1736301 RepID=UPI0006F67B10|nr:cytochrome c oxidase subunit II [Sphingomonas sp. Leaf231]KQN93197.1 cytochrome C oxidase subunit II [Sphingomonas sp. Leaf231]